MARCHNKIQNYTFYSTAALPRGQWVNSEILSDIFLWCMYRSANLPSNGCVPHNMPWGLSYLPLVWLCNSLSLTFNNCPMTCPVGCCMSYYCCNCVIVVVCTRGGLGALPLWESVGMRHGFAPHFPHLDDLFAPQNLTMSTILFRSCWVPFRSPTFSACRRSFCPQNWPNLSFYSGLVGSRFELRAAHLYWFWPGVPPTPHLPPGSVYHCCDCVIFYLLPLVKAVCPMTLHLGCSAYHCCDCVIVYLLPLVKAVCPMTLRLGCKCVRLLWLCNSLPLTSSKGCVPHDTPSWL